MAESGRSRSESPIGARRWARRKSDDAKRDLGSPPAGLRPREQKRAFPRVAREPRRGLERHARFGQPTGAEQKIPPRRRQRRIVAQSLGVGDCVQQAQAFLGPKGHAVGDRSVEFDHRRRYGGAQPVIERGDARPIGVFGPARTGMARGERGLQRIGALPAQEPRRAPAPQNLGRSASGPSAPDPVR